MTAWLLLAVIAPLACLPVIFRRPRVRYDVVQIQNGAVVKVHATGVSRRSATETAETVNRMLLWMRLVAPSGPQDARAEIRVTT